ncbi:MAG: formate dehydrogenase accessory sulfurtransferase FdhD [Candidatus Bathyarchaeota archaeon]
MTKFRDEKIDTVKAIEIIYLRTDTGQHERRKDFVTVEEPLHLLINRVHYATILSTPTQKRELALGHLMTEGIIKRLDEIKEIRIDGQTCNIMLRSDVNLQERLALVTPFRRIVTSECTTPEQWLLYKLVDRLKAPKVTSEVTVDSKTIVEAARSFSKEATIHLKTGGVHAAALHTLFGVLIAFSEDIGRHNAVDKVIGAALLNNCKLEESFLTSTGRITGDMALKAARVGIPIVASLSAAVYSGIEVAERTGMTIIGFVRGERMNIYTHSERVV